MRKNIRLNNYGHGKQKGKRISITPNFILSSFVIAFFVGFILVVCNTTSETDLSDEIEALLNRMNGRLSVLEGDVRNTLYEIQEFSNAKIEDVNTKLLKNPTFKTVRKSESWLSKLLNMFGSAIGSSNKLRSYANSNSNALSVKNDDEIVELAQNGIKMKGKYIFYQNSYGHVHTNGSYYKYSHNFSDLCEIEKISLKFLSNCPEGQRTLMIPPETDDQYKKNLTFIRPLLVIAVQRSGTHYVWEMLNRLGVEVHHEGVGPAGAISWLFAYKLDMFPDPSKPALIKPGRTKPPPNKYVINNQERLTHHRFKYVFHQVRHPLRVISTLLARCGKWDRIWLWLSYMDGLEDINQHQSPLKRSMLLWFLWNRHIESYADLRFRSEDTSPRDVCKWSGFDHAICSRVDGISGSVVEPIASAISGVTELSSGNNGDNQPVIPSPAGKKQEKGTDNNNIHNNSSKDDIIRLQWRDLEKADAALARQIKVMCLEYGYSLDPNTHRQHAATREFTA